ncbi:LTA synthase family protein [Luteimonas sp. MHLX1A]|uniref:LTA synthase family protein n=1 Tax=Alterluteimonas muca TaxID=2878684 RepID=UPI001E2D8775|nr:LTA synthase family protein [Luteimonas sp. MHLX1A]MCD9046464.1 LTA synthase family protein [Luteimonas sp. MHLX1A]
MPQTLRHGLAPLLPFLSIFVLGLLLLSLSRLGLSLWQADAVGAAGGWTQVLVQGVRVDVAAMCMWLGIAAAAYLLLPASLARRPQVAIVFAVWLALALAIPMALEAATPAFMAEYGLRPNRLFIEYLAYPREVSSMLAKGHLLTGLATVLVTLAAAWFAYRLARRLLARHPHHPGTGAVRALGAVMVLLACTLGIRSTLGHRPMNPAMLAFSTDATVNTLPLNSFYSLAFAIRDELRHDPGARIYDPTTPDEEVADALRGISAAWPGATVVKDASVPLLLRRDPVHHGPPRNLVIVLEESLGARFVGSLGGLPLTPRFDALATRGWAFDQLYATGTRSVRGIEAVVSGYPPTPSVAVVKRPRAQQDFFTLAALLRRHGYDTAFHYGGESHFDNMRGFFLGNGFERIIERKDHAAPGFVGSWGVSDEDLFAEAHADFERLHAAGTPFFGFIFTSSNHDPFEFPDDRIELYDAPKATRNNAAKYADHALGGFFERAMSSTYWADTVFLVVADHDSRVLGQSLVPVDNFRIPGLILGAGVEPRRDTRLVSQIDLAPTLLSLLGIDDATPLLGRDLNRDDPTAHGRAPMQYDANFGWLEDDGTLVVLQPGQAPRAFVHRPGRPLVASGAPSAEAQRLAALHALWGTVAYERGWYRLPEGP